MRIRRFLEGLAIGYALGLAGGFFLHKYRRPLKRKVMELKAEAEIARKMREAKRFTRENYDAAVDSVLDTYERTGKLAGGELDRLSEALKRHWRKGKRAYEAARSALSEEDEDEAELGDAE